MSDQLLNNLENSESSAENKNNTTDLTSQSNDKKKEVWVNSIKADGGAYKGCPKNDYCQHFVDSGERPQNFIRDYEEEKRFLDYPKLNELIKRKNEVLQKRATPPMWQKCDLKGYDLSTLGKFDVILIDPPLPEYQSRMEGLGLDNTNNMNSWSFEEIANLRMEHLAESCCFIFLWVGSSEGLDKGRLLLKKWNFRRCEDIVWIKTNRHNFKKRYYNDGDTLLQHTKEHCLVGIRGQVKRGVDGHFIHANIDTDVIVSEEPPLGSTEKPQELYRIIERFCLGRKRIELFGEDHNRRPGWLTLGEFCYPDVQGYEGGRFVGCTPEIENLRPRSPSRMVPNANSLKMNNPNNSFMNPNWNNFNVGIGFNMNNFNTLPMNNMNFAMYNNLPMWQNSQDLSRMNSLNTQVGNSSHPLMYDYSVNAQNNNGVANQNGVNGFIANSQYDDKDSTGSNLINNSFNFNQN